MATHNMSNEPLNSKDPLPAPAPVADSALDDGALADVAGGYSADWDKDICGTGFTPTQYVYGSTFIPIDAGLNI
jgi:hypothetical protein